MTDLGLSFSLLINYFPSSDFTFPFVIERNLLNQQIKEKMVSERIKAILGILPQGVQLCAVSKYHPAEMIQEAYDAGQRIFGESHVQELRQKQPALPQDIEWHFIGHLQTNKVKYIAPYISLIHAVDSPKLLQEINREINTIGSKCNNAETARIVVDVKCEIEKVREQIQNIE